MSQAEDPQRIARKQSAQDVSVEDVRRLMGASTPHFALQIRNRIANLIAGRLEQETGEAEIVFHDEDHAIPRLDHVTVVSELVEIPRGERLLHEHRGRRLGKPYRRALF